MDSATPSRVGVVGMRKYQTSLRPLSSLPYLCPAAFPSFPLSSTFLLSLHSVSAFLLFPVYASVCLSFPVLLPSLPSLCPVRPFLRLSFLLLVPPSILSSACPSLRLSFPPSFPPSFHGSLTTIPHCEFALHTRSHPSLRRPRPLFPHPAMETVTVQ